MREWAFVLFTPDVSHGTADFLWMLWSGGAVTDAVQGRLDGEPKVRTFREASGGVVKSATSSVAYARRLPRTLN